MLGAIDTVAIFDDMDIALRMTQMRIDRKATQKRALTCQAKVRGLTDMEHGIFIERGHWLWRMRTYELWKLVAEEDPGVPLYHSFDEWCADPVQNLTPSSANLAAQVIELFVMFYRIPARCLYGIGEKKFQLLAPVVAKMRSDYIEDRSPNRLDWGNDNDDWLIYYSDRREVAKLLESAKTLSWSGLSDTITLKVRGQDTFFRGKMTVGMLRAADTSAAILDMLGISDLPDSVVISLTLRGPAQ